MLLCLQFKVSKPHWISVLLKLVVISSCLTNMSWCWPMVSELEEKHLIICSWIYLILTHLWSTSWGIKNAIKMEKTILQRPSWTWRQTSTRPYCRKESRMLLHLSRKKSKCCKSNWIISRKQPKRLDHNKATQSIARDQENLKKPVIRRSSTKRTTWMDEQGIT